MSDQHGPDKYEESDWNAKPVVVTILALFSFLILGLVLGSVTQKLTIMALDQSEEPTVFHDTKALPPAPRLQVDEAADLHEFRDREDTLLSATEWTDASRTAVRIPIDRAIDLMAAESGRGRK